MSEPNAWGPPEDTLARLARERDEMIARLRHQAEWHDVGSDRGNDEGAYVE